jgi:hypothetical protein
LIDAWKPYASKSDLGDGGFGYSAMDSMATDAFLSTFINVKKFQNSNASKNIAVNIVRGESKFFLQQLSECFDFIYIDGDHKYDAVKSDLQQAKRIIKKNDSIICGDDLERLPSESLIELSRMHTDKDYIRDQSFHPGVLLAVAEEFGTVNMFNGFWWIYCRNGVFSITLWFIYKDSDDFKHFSDRWCRLSRFNHGPRFTSFRTSGDGAGQFYVSTIQPESPVLPPQF